MSDCVKRSSLVVEKMNYKKISFIALGLKLTNRFSGVLVKSLFFYLEIDI